MSTLVKLQAMLMQPVVEYRPGLTFKPITPLVRCADGTSLSVQASESHYSCPRENYGPYTEVEVWCIRSINKVEVLEFEYDDDEPSAYVNINSVVAYIDRHGGLAP